MTARCRGGRRVMTGTVCTLAMLWMGAAGCAADGETRDGAGPPRGQRPPTADDNGLSGGHMPPLLDGGGGGAESIHAAVQSMAAAAGRDDLAALADRIDPRSERGRQGRDILRGLAELDRLESALRQRAVARFGREGLRLFPHRPSEQRRPLAELLGDADKLSIDRLGHRAYVHREDRPELGGVHLTLIEGRWYLVAAELFDDPQQILHAIARHGRALREALSLIELSPSPQVFEQRYRDSLADVMDGPGAGPGPGAEP